MFTTHTYSLSIFCFYFFFSYLFSAANDDVFLEMCISDILNLVPLFCILIFFQQSGNTIKAQEVVKTDDAYETLDATE